MSRREFLERRQRGIGSSDAARVLGQSEYGGPLDVYMEKVGPVDDSPRTGPMARGTELEDMICELLQRQSPGRELVRVPQQQHPNHPFILAHPDRAIFRPETPDDPGVLEVKAPGSRMMRRIREHGLSNDYALQIQHEMLASTATWGTFAVLDYDEWEVLAFDVAAHPTLHREMVNAYAQFWEHVEKLDPPRSAIELVELPDGIWEWPSEYAVVSGEVAEQIGKLLAARELKKRGQELEKTYRAEIERFMDEHELLAIEAPEIGRVTWKPQEGNKRFELDRLKAAQPLDPKKVRELFGALPDTKLSLELLLEAILTECSIDLEEYYGRTKPYRRFLPKPPPKD